MTPPPAPSPGGPLPPKTRLTDPSPLDKAVLLLALGAGIVVGLLLVHSCGSTPAVTPTPAAVLTPVSTIVGPTPAASGTPEANVSPEATSAPRMPVAGSGGLLGR